MAYASSNPAYFGSNVAYAASNVAYLGSNTAHASSNAAYFGSNTAQVASNVAYFGSNMAYTMSNRAYMAYASSNPAYFGSNMAYASSNPAYFGSNMAYASSNAAYFGSNMAYASLNAAHFGSNTAHASSNAAHFGSNTAFIGSNSSVFGSNAAVFSSNASVFGSNTVVWSSNSTQWSSNQSIISSNTTVWSSNAAVFGSNVAFQSSNMLLGWSSNATAFGSNTAAWGSNTVQWCSNAALASSNVVFASSFVRSYPNSNAMQSGIVMASTSTAAPAGVNALFSNAQGQSLEIGIASESAGAPTAFVSSKGGADMGVSAASPGVSWISGGGGIGRNNPSMLFPPAGISEKGTLCNVLYGVGKYEPFSSSSSSSAWLAFSGSNPNGSILGGTSWTSASSYYSTGGTYGQATVSSPSTVADGGSNTYLGEWLQLGLPDVLTPTSYTIVPQLTASNANNSQPASFALLGSYDGGSTWKTLESAFASQTGSPYSPPNTTITLSIPFPSSSIISAVRLVVTRVTSTATSGTLVPVTVCAMSFQAPPARATLAVGGSGGNGGSPSAIVATGNLGIGTVSPQQRLDVRGCAAFSQGVGIGMTSAPLYQLQLTQDSAAKPSTNTWTVYSDRRLKNDKGRADLKRCYDIVKTLPLSRFQWKDGTHSVEDVPDRCKLGWYAQDVRAAFPKSVETKDAFGMSDCLTMNSDQIIAVLYGAVQLMQKRIETLENLFSGGPVGPQ